MYQLYYYPRNASFAPHLVLEELGLDFQLVLVDRKKSAQKGKDYLALNPSGRIPTLVDGDTVIFESAAICMHICENEESQSLLPRWESRDRPAFFQWLFYLTTTVQPELMVYFYPDKHTLAQETSQFIVKAQDGRLSRMFGLLDRRLQSQKYLVGDTLTVCDCFLFMLSLWADELQRPPLSFPALADHLRKLARRPAFRRVCEKEEVDLAAYQ